VRHFSATKRVPRDSLCGEWFCKPLWKTWQVSSLYPFYQVSGNHAATLKNGNMNASPTHAEIINEVRSRIEEARASILFCLRKPLTAAGSMSLCKGRAAARALIPEAVEAIQTNAHLVLDGKTPDSVREHFERGRALRLLSIATSSLAVELTDTVRQVESELYRVALDAYYMVGVSGGDAIAMSFAVDMKDALAVGPRTNVSSSRPYPNSKNG
jgi:hypothetical protein